MPFKYAHSRKACYQYSWDWAPELISMGIWKNVELKIWDEVRIDYVWVRNKIVSQDKVVLNFATKL
jgi:beta-mannosidase